MIKKSAIAIILCVAALFSAVDVNAVTVTNENTEYDFGDRIFYGGIAVDVGEDVFISENGAIWRKSPLGVTEKVIDTAAKYLNFCSGKLYFVSGNRIVSCETDGSSLSVIKDFGESEISCLYVTENAMFYLMGETVYRESFGKTEELITRSGIVGFVPESDSEIRWFSENQSYVPIDESGDSVWREGTAEYIEYIALSGSGSDASEDTASANTDDGIEVIDTSGEYSGPYTQVGSAVMPFVEHMPGTYFSKNGQACTCHNTYPNTCVASTGNCNCMRYYPTGYAATCEVDLLGAQCFAFSRMVFYRCFGYTDSDAYSGLFYNVGTIASGAATANSVKALLMKAAPGAHVRLSWGHSVSILAMDDEFIYIYHGNAGGDNVNDSPCVVSTRRYTWEEFANTASRGIEYIHMPYNYPESSDASAKKYAGYYKINVAEGLKLRAEPNTSCAYYCVLPINTVVDVTEINGRWGKMVYNGYTGWIFLEYTDFERFKKITPTDALFSRGSDGYLRSAEWKMSADEIALHFSGQSISVSASDGTAVSDSGILVSGMKLSLMNGSDVSDTAVIILAGDVNTNGRMDVGDYLSVRRMIMGSMEFSDIQTASADVDGSGTVDKTDYILMKRYFISENLSLLSGFMP